MWEDSQTSWFRAVAGKVTRHLGIMSRVTSRVMISEPALSDWNKTMRKNRFAYASSSVLIAPGSSDVAVIL
jgi:hypothetical protein